MRTVAGACWSTRREGYATSREPGRLGGGLSRPLSAGSHPLAGLAGHGTGQAASGAADAAEALRLTAHDLKGFGVIDEILPEPAGGAHMDPAAMAETVADAIREHLKQLRRIKTDSLLARRYKKFRAMGAVLER